MKFTEAEKRLLKSLVQDCSLYGLSEKEALAYIASRFGKAIGPAYYYILKKKLESDTTTQAWLNEFSRIGFVSEHRKRLEELQLVQKILFEMLYKERQKGDNADQSAILSIIDEISRISKRLTGLQSGTPIISQISVMLEQHSRASIITTTDSADAKYAGEGKSKDNNDDSVLFANMVADIEDPIRKYETLAALYKARADELHAKKSQQQQ